MRRRDPRMDLPDLDCRSETEDEFGIAENRAPSGKSSAARMGSESRRTRLVASAVIWGSP